jgi:NitT/TauT family transport system permease protein
MTARSSPRSPRAELSSPEGAGTNPRTTRVRSRHALVDLGLPAAVFIGAILGWEALVRVADIPPYVLPAPSAVLTTLWANLGSLMQSWLFTIKITVGALLLAATLGVAMAMLFAYSPWVERSLFPFAIVLQVTPVVAIAPLILIYVDSTTAALLICAWIVAFFPVLSNTVVGLRSTDSNLEDLFFLYRASRWQRLRWLLVPTALPYFMAGLKIAGGLSLIGAVVAEFTAGAAGRETGLASRILEASFRTEVPKMFAALVLVSLTGVVIFVGFGLLSKLLLGHWHESERDDSH